MSAGSLVTKTKKGHRYLYWVRSARVDGKPRIVEQIYLGPKERVIQEIHSLYAGQSSVVPQMRRVQVRTFGGPALLWELARDWGLAALIDRHVPAAPPRVRTSLSVGQYLVLAAINRALCPHSKRSFDAWYRGTVLERACPAQHWELTSQRFWDHMDLVSEDHIQAIQRELLGLLADRFPVGISGLLYDTTNYYTFVSTFNERCELAQRGHNKQKRGDLRQVSLSLVVDEEVGLPLFHEVYVGNRVDVTQFGAVVGRLRQHFISVLGDEARKLTLVFDKGNVSKPNLKRLSQMGLCYVGAVPLAWVGAAAVQPLSAYEPLRLGEGVRVKVLRRCQEVLGAERTVVVVFSPSFYWEQRRSLNRLQGIAEQKLAALREEVAAAVAAGKPKKAAAVEKEAARITSRDRIKDYVRLVVERVGEHAVCIGWNWDLAKKREIQRRYFGKTALITDREEWASEQVIRAYRSQYLAEDCFRVSKSRSPGMWWPMHHWTDSKVRVHALYCHLALLLLRLAASELKQQGLNLSVSGMVERLNGIDEAFVVYANGTGQRVIAEMTPKQMEVFAASGLGRLSSQWGNTILAP
jgi:transposase